MDKFLETYSMPKLDQEETDNLNRLMIKSELESVILKISANKSPGPDSFTGEFYQTYKKNNLHSSFSNSSKRLKRREHSQIHS